MHALEHQHGTLADGGTVERATHPQCEVCNKPILDGGNATEVRGEPAHADCGGQARCDGGWEVEQQGIDGEPAQGQTTISGGVAKDGGDR